MRIISGKLKARRFELPSDRWKTRPTTDMARESLFNILSNWIDLEGITVLDLFAGSGAVGYEFLSRGAKQVDFVEKFGPCLAFIKKQLASFACSKQGLLHKIDVFTFLKNAGTTQYNLIFADPPYALAKMRSLPDLIFNGNILKKEGILIIEHDHRHNFENHLNFAEARTYGQTIFSFFETSTTEISNDC